MSKHVMQPQKEKNYCVIAVLKEILYQNNYSITQDRLARALTPSENGFLVDDYRINKLMKFCELNYKYYPYNATPFNEPDTLLKEMSDNHGFFGVKNHVYMLKEFKDPILIYIDPKDCSENKKDIYELMNEMKNDFGFFGLIKKLK